MRRDRKLKHQITCTLDLLSNFLNTHIPEEYLGHSLRYARTEASGREKFEAISMNLSLPKVMSVLQQLSSYYHRMCKLQFFCSQKRVTFDWNRLSLVFLSQ